MDRDAMWFISWETFHTGSKHLCTAMVTQEYFHWRQMTCSLVLSWNSNGAENSLLPADVKSLWGGGQHLLCVICGVLVSTTVAPSLLCKSTVTRDAWCLMVTTDCSSGLWIYTFSLHFRVSLSLILFKYTRSRVLSCPCSHLMHLMFICTKPHPGTELCH